MRWTREGRLDDDAPVEHADPRRIAYDAWIAEADSGARRQGPVDELLAEHYLMTTVLAAIEAEAEGMLLGRSLRFEFWRDAVDFNGNFVHLCHRVKEEEHLIPALARHGLLEGRENDAIRHEHESAKALTLDLCNGVAEGDWERALRLVSIYLHVLRPHMRREEAGVFAAAAERLSAEVRGDLRLAFDAVDREALAGRGRGHYVAIARRLSEACGIAATL